MAGARLRLAGRYESYRLICRWLNIKRQVGGKRYEVREGMRKVFIKDICNILLLSFVLTKWILLSTDVRRSPSLSREGSDLYSSYQLAFAFLTYNAKTGIPPYNLSSCL